MPLHRHPHPDSFDRFGILLSLVCLVHCLALPLLMLALQFWGIATFSESHSHTFHLVFAFILLGVGGLAFGQGFLRHRRPAPLFAGTIGTLFLFLGALNPGHLLPHSQEHLITIVGSLILVWAHYQNRFVCGLAPRR